MPGDFKGLLLVAGFCLSSASVLAASADWQPLSSEKLIRLPPNYLSQTIESDYLASPLAAQIDGLDEGMAQTVTVMHDLKAAIGEVSGEQQVELKHQFLQAKSDYLDAMAQKQALDQQALETRRQLYEAVLTH
jgi:hypothetical protein